VSSCGVLRCCRPEQDRAGITVFFVRSKARFIPKPGSAIRRRRHAMPEVREFYRMAGDVDYMLRVVGR